MGTPSTFPQLFTTNHLAYLPLLFPSSPGPSQKMKRMPRPTTLGRTPPSPLPASTTTPIGTVGPSPFAPSSLSNSTTANVNSSPTKTPATLSPPAAKSEPSSSTTNAAAAPSPLTPKVPSTSASCGTCSGDGRCDGTGGTSTCSGCPTFNSTLSLSPRMELESVAAANAALAAFAPDSPMAVIDPDLTAARMESDVSGSPVEARNAESDGEVDQPKKKGARRGAKVQGPATAGRSSLPQHRALPRNLDGLGIPSYMDLDLERHYVEWTELKKKWEEMMERTDRWMADVKQTLDEMRGSVAQQSTPPPSLHSESSQQQPQQSQPQPSPAPATAAGSPKSTQQPQPSTASSSSPQLQPIEDATVVPAIPPNRGELEQNVIWPVVDATSVHD